MSLKDTFADPTLAMKFRDILADTVHNIVNKIRPNPQYGVVLTVYKGGAEFRIGDSTAPEGPPPEGPGNPRQLYYASVRLDTGEIVTARVHTSIPVFRPSVLYDPLVVSEGATQPFLISEDVYRRRIVVQRTNEIGQVYDSVEPEPLHMQYPPYVPPRVMLEGTAGTYVLTRIVRGLARYENPVLDSPYIVNAGRVYNHVIDPAYPEYTELRPMSSEYTTQYQGFVGDCGWTGEGTFEVELAYGKRLQKYIFSTQDITSTEWESWRIIPPVYETSGHKDPAFPVEESLNVLLGYLDATGALFLYVATRTTVDFAVESDRYLGGTVTLRAVNRALTAKTGAVLPTDPGSLGTSLVWGLSRTEPIYTSLIDYAPISTGSSAFEVNLRHLQYSLTGGGVKVCEYSADQTQIFFRWEQRFVVMTAKNPYSSQGYFDIIMPPEGTEIPAVGGNATDGGPLTTRPVTSQGIDMSSWCGLYYALPFGTGASVPGNFVLVIYTGWFDIPEHWILVARRNADSGYKTPLMLGNGQELGMWKSWADNVANIGDSNYPPSVMKQGNIAYLSGGVENTHASASVPSGATSTNAPLLGYAPWRRFVGRAMYIPPSGDGIAMRFDVHNTGNITYYKTIPPNGQVFFDGICYPVQN